MVDFRYHLVSIVAIFLALAIGIVLGAGPLKTTSDTQLKTQVSDLRQARSTLQDQLNQAQGQVQFLDRFATQLAPALLNDRLAGFDVAVVSMPGASSDLTSGLVTTLAQAGATVSVQARINGSWTDPGHRGALAQALRTGAVAPVSPGSSASPAPTVSPPSAVADPSASASAQPSAGATVYADAAGQLATALLTSASSPALPSGSSASPAPSSSGTAVGRPSPHPTGGAATAAPRRSVSPTKTTAATESPAVVAGRTLAALVAGGFVGLSAPVPRQHPSLVVIVAADPPQPVDDGARAAAAELATLSDALRAGSDGAVVSGDAAAAGDGGLLALVRASKPSTGGLSTVDSADTPAERIAVPLALLQQQTGGAVGQYGSVGSTDGPLPPLPTFGTG